MPAFGPVSRHGWSTAVPNAQIPQNTDEATSRVRFYSLISIAARSALSRIASLSLQRRLFRHNLSLAYCTCALTERLDPYRLKIPTTWPLGPGPHHHSICRKRAVNLRRRDPTIRIQNHPTEALCPLVTAKRQYGFGSLELWRWPLQAHGQVAVKKYRCVPP